MRYGFQAFTAISFFLLLSCAQSTPKPAPVAASDGNPPPFVDSTFDDNPLRWELVSNQNGIKIYHDIYAAPGRIDFKAKTNLNASIEKVATALTDFEVRKEWVNVLVDNHAIKIISDFQRIEYAKLKASYPYPFMDFVYLQTFSILRQPRSLLIRLSSSNAEKVPLPENTVRGQLINSYNLVRQVDPTHSELAFELGIDPKEAYASWQSQKVVSDWFYNTILALKNKVEDPKFKVSPKVLAYIKEHKLE
jgi:hypothetical protein